MKIGIFGYGTMGRAIATTLLSQPRSDMYHISTLSLQPISEPNISSVESFGDLCDNAEIIFLCIKPQDFHALSPISLSSKKSQPLFISIMAGVTISSIQQKMGTSRIVRTMPNLPLQVGKGVIGWTVSQNVFSDTEMELIKKMMCTLGLDVYVSDEDQLNIITAISGSGPAYVFLFIDALMRAGIALGLSEHDAHRLAIATTEGSLAYLSSNPQIPLPELIERVTSKGGTTEAALRTIDTEHYYDNWTNGIRAAYVRSKELSQ